jgi:hypothetical protein
MKNVNAGDMIVRIKHTSNRAATMPALVFIVVLAILFKIFPGSLFFLVMLWISVMEPPAGAIASFCRAHGLIENWAVIAMILVGISLIMSAVLTSYFAWKWWRVAERRKLYFNLFILAAGIPAAIIFGLAVTVTD